MKKVLVVIAVVCCLIFISCEATVSLSESYNFEPVFRQKQYLDLPPPWFPDMIYEEAIARRMSVRQFSDDKVSLENISTILWGVYGNFNGTRSIETFDGRHVIKVYVLLEDGAYEYLPINHTLALVRPGDHRKIGQYDTAAFKLGFVWDKSVCNNQSIAAAEIGMIGQNVYLMANALGLGTVTTALLTNQLYLLYLPLSEKPMIIMQIGYPLNPYYFTYEPFESGLPFPKNSSKSFVDAVFQKQRWPYLSGDLSKDIISQVLWAGYGTSFLIDNINGKRHRSVPSSIGKYPLEILFANSSGLYNYRPYNHSLNILSNGDVREKVASASFPWVSSADVFLIVLNTSKSNMSWAWYYEAGAIWHNMLLEAGIFGLSANVIVDFDHEMITNELQLKGYLPLIILQMGQQNGSDDESPELSITFPESGYLYFFGSKIGNSVKTVIIGILKAEIQVIDDSLLMVEYYINDKLFAEQYWGPTEVNIPRFFFKNCEFKVIALDYFGHSSEAIINFIKIF